MQLLSVVIRWVPEGDAVQLGWANIQNSSAGGFAHPLHMIMGPLNPANINSLDSEGKDGRAENTLQEGTDPKEPNKKEKANMYKSKRYKQF